MRPSRKHLPTGPGAGVLPAEQVPFFATLQRWGLVIVAHQRRLLRGVESTSPPARRVTPTGHAIPRGK